jgi:hypothetical protein
MKFANNWRPVVAVIAVGLLLTCLLMPQGCRPANRPQAKRPSAGSASQRDARGLLDSIVAQLRTLPESSQLELTPPAVVLDARSSADGEEVQGIISRRPEAPSEPANLVTIPRGNGGFRKSVKPGDIVKYYGVPDKATQQKLDATAEVDIRTGQRDYSTADVDVLTFDAIDLIVAQVLDDNSLLVVGGFPNEDVAVRKIEVWRVVDSRMEEIQREWGAYVARREPPLEWHPSADEASLGQLTERFNQWLRQVGAAGKRADAAAWKRPALLATLPESLASSADLKPFLADSELATGYFRPYESRLIQGATWQRDVSRWARGGDVTPLAVARTLFDWTTVNVQLVEPSQTPPRWPWESMLHAQATAAGRAWVFAGLCQQQHLTAVAVVVPVEGDERLLVGVVDGEELRLFDPALGLPLPGADEGSIATLSEVQADDELLRKLDLDGEPYPLTTELMKGARVGVVADAFSLTRRAKELDTKLSGDDALVLAVDVDGVAEQLRKVKGVGEVVLWPQPIQTLADKLVAKPSERRQAVRDFLPFAWRPELWRGRLQQFRGVQQEADVKRNVLDDTLDDHKAALRYFMSRKVRPSEKSLDQQQVPDEKREIYRSARTLGTLFLALLSYDDGAFSVALDWLNNPAMDDTSAGSYEPQVLQLKARSLEGLGKLEEAATVLDTIEGPMATGAKLRARMLRERAAASDDASDDEPAADEP